MGLRRHLARWWRVAFIAVCVGIAAAAITSLVDAGVAIAGLVVVIGVLLLWFDARLQSSHARMRTIAADAASDRRAIVQRLDAAARALERLNGAVDDAARRLDVVDGRLDELGGQVGRNVQRFEQFGEQRESLIERVDRIETDQRALIDRTRRFDEQFRSSWAQRLKWTEDALADLEDAVEEQALASDPAPLDQPLTGRDAADGDGAPTSRGRDAAAATPRERPIRLYWWRHPSRRLPNFGDELSRLVVTSIAGRPVVHASPNRCDLVAIGSVLEHLMSADRDTPVPVWGAGFIAGESEFRADAVVPYAVRGHLSAARVGGSPAVGDPGLLARHLVGAVGKRYSVGLVPHLVDRGHPVLDWFGSNVARSIVISPLQDPLVAIAQIAACDSIVSSSLHGLVVADSFGVPNRWVTMSDGVIGAGYKFRDHLSCFGIDEPTPLPFRDPAEAEDALDGAWAEAYQRPGLDDLIDRLVASFPDAF